MPAHFTDPCADDTEAAVREPSPAWLGAQLESLQAERLADALSAQVHDAQEIRKRLIAFAFLREPFDAYAHRLCNELRALPAVVRGAGVKS